MTQITHGQKLVKQFRRPINRGNPFQNRGNGQKIGAMPEITGATARETGATPVKVGAIVHQSGAEGFRTGATTFENGAASLKSGAGVFGSGAVLVKAGATADKSGQHETLGGKRMKLVSATSQRLGLSSWTHGLHLRFSKKSGGRQAHFIWAAKNVCRLRNPAGSYSFTLVLEGRRIASGASRGRKVRTPQDAMLRNSSLLG
jgi:hypothetical protein